MNKSLCLVTLVTYDFGCLAHILQKGINDSFADSDGKVIKFVGKEKKLKRGLHKYHGPMARAEISNCIHCIPRYFCCD